MSETCFMSCKCKMETFLQFIKHSRVFFSANKGKMILKNQVGRISSYKGRNSQEKIAICKIKQSG